MVFAARGFYASNLKRPTFCPLPQQVLAPVLPGAFQMINKGFVSVEQNSNAVELILIRFGSAKTIKTEAHEHLRIGWNQFGMLFTKCFQIGRASCRERG